MILPVHELVRDRITSALGRLYALEGEAVPPIVIDYPPNRELGDLAVPLAFELAKRLRKAPKMIAEEIAAALAAVPGIARVEATKGYLNLFLDRAEFLRRALAAAPAAKQKLRPTAPEAARVDANAVKTIVEHTAINPNKAAHIGHLRNSALGDTLVRVLQFRGVPVEVQNYIDDTGVQVADVVVGFRELEDKDLAAVRQIADTTRFDYYCWDLYAKVAEWYEADKARLQHRSDTLHAIEHGGNDAAEMAAFIADRIVRCHLLTMARMNVAYDLLAWEGDILRLHFWARAFAILKEKGAVFLQDQGRLAGCWVMRIEEEGGDAGQAPRDEDGHGVASRRRTGVSPVGDSPAAAADAADAADDENREKVIVRSNGTVTYVGKDMAYQFWKFGVLGEDFHYRIFARDASGRAGLGHVGQRHRTRRQPPALRQRGRRVQRHRRAPVVPAETAETGARSRLATLSRRSDRSTSRTKWSRSPTTRPGSWATCCPRRTPHARSSRCPAARALASRRTTCWTSLIRKAGEEVAKRNRGPGAPMPPGRSRKRLPSRPSATSWSASRAERSSRSTSTKR